MLGVFVGAIIGVGFSISDFWSDLIISLIAVFVFMAGANSLNDYFDRKTDKVNHPERPIPSGEISSSFAKNFGILLLLISIFSGIFINLTSFLIVCLAVILIIGYETGLKKKGLVGNITISILVGLLFIFGGSVVNSLDLNIILAVMAALATLCREIVKDIEDIKGDIDRHTLPKKIGVKPAGKVAAASLLTAVIISPLPYFSELFPSSMTFNAVGFHYLIVVIAADIVFLKSIIDIDSNAKNSSNLLKIGMVIALAAFLSAALI
jgi:geranylgeranylglycerol-phosphate geranylgeranyltransferase